MKVKKFLKWIFGWIKGENAWMLAGFFFTLIWFDLDWCMSTTFRPMSNPQLYLINFTASLLLLAPWMLTRSRVVSLIVLLIVTLVSEANLIYCRTYFTAIPPGGYLMAGNMADYTNSIWSNLRWTDLGFVIIITIIAIYCARPKPSDQRKFLRPYSITTCIFALLSYIYILCLGGFYKAYDRLVQEWMTYTSGVPTYTLAGHIIYKLMEDERLKNPDPKEIESVENWMRYHQDRYRPNLCDNPKKNIVLVICESLESWPLGLEIDGKEVTPFLNSLINDSTTFFAPHVLTQVCSGHSIDGQLMYTTGLLPTSNAVYSMKYPDRNYPSLNKILRKDRNAKSILMTTDKPTTWNMLAVAKAFEYDTIFNHNNWEKDEMIFRSISDKSFFRQSLSEMKKGMLWPENSPAMLTFITCSGHHPFVLKKEFRDPDFDISKLGLPKLLEDYITVTHYVDSQLNTVIDYVKSRSDFEDTMIVILGDHEGLGVNRKEFLASSDFAREYVGKGRYTPFIVINSPVSGKYDDVLGQVDVFPTILDFLGISDKEWRGMGVSVLDPSKPKVAISAMPLEMDGDAEGCSAEELDHIKSAQSVSELIIMHDLYGKNRH